MVKPSSKAKSKSTGKIKRYFNSASRVQRIGVFIIGFALIGGGYMVIRSSASSLPLNLYYPNFARIKASYYLEGNNYTGATPNRSVLWFQNQGNQTFKQYNSAPYDTCHWDLLSWQTGSLVYSKTHDQCGTNNNEIDYTPGVTFMPKNLNANLNWSTNGSSAAVYYDKGVIACSGTNTWNSKAMGWVTLASGVQALWIQNFQSTAWTYGTDPSGCTAGYTSHWQENFYLYPNLPIYNTSSTDYALKREVGGNIDSFNSSGHWDYDVWFDSWKKLP